MPNYWAFFKILYTISRGIFFVTLLCKNHLFPYPTRGESHTASHMTRYGSVVEW